MDQETCRKLGIFGSAVVVGAAATAIVPTLLMGAVPTLSIAVLGTALGGVTAGLFANDLGALNNSLKDTDLRNAHLTRAVGIAIAVVIRTVAADWKQKKRADDRSLIGLEAMAQTARADWAEIVQNTLKDRVPAGLDEKELAATYFSEVTTNFEKLRALAGWEDWIPVIETLRRPAQERLRRSAFQRVKRWLKHWAISPVGAIEGQCLQDLAQQLHELFPKAIREVLKQDFSQGKESFAAMIFDLLGNLTQEVRQLRQQIGLSGGDVAKLDQLSVRLAEFEGRNVEQLRALAGRMDSGFDRVLAALNLQQVRIQYLFAESFQTVLDAIVRDGEQTRTVVIRENENTRLVVEEKGALSRYQNLDVPKLKKIKST